MNTLTISKRLIKAGMSREMAEEQAQVLNDVTQGLATNADIERLDQKIEALDQKVEALDQKVERLDHRMERRLNELRADMKQFIKWLIGTLIGIGALIVAAIKIPF